MDLWNPSLRLPEFWHLDAVLQDFASYGEWPALEDWSEAAHDVKNSAGLPVKFIPHAPRKRGGAWTLDSMYDAHIFRRGEVPSRERNWHDFFNMAIWRTFPLAKAAINRAQWEALEKWLPGTSGAKLPGARLPEQDTLALLDEGGVLVAITASSSETAQPSEADAAIAMNEGRATVLLFGHALLEHLVTGHGEVRGASVILSAASWPEEKGAFLSALDRALASNVDRGVSVRRGERGLSLALAKTHAFGASASVERFTSRADDYLRYRPTYPAELYDWLGAKLASQSGRRAPSRHVVDVGAGTGISTEPFLERGVQVTAVEPNEGMRRSLFRLQEKYPGLVVSTGNAENTGLAAATADLILVAQAFHWFDPSAFREEAKRVLSPGGGVALVWNDRRTDDSDFSRAYEALLLEGAPAYAAVSRKWIASQEGVAAFFAGANVHAASFDNMQTFDEDGLRGRARSSSYVPAEGTPGHDAFYTKLHDLFVTHAENGTVNMVYRTRVWYGAFSGSEASQPELRSAQTE